MMHFGILKDFLFVNNDAIYFIRLLWCIHTVVIFLLRLLYVFVIIWHDLSEMTT